MNEATPRRNARLAHRICDFATIPEALDYAAQGETGLNFYSARGQLVERLTYRDLRAQAIPLARRMRAAGLRAGDRLAILADTHGDFMRVFFAAQYAGVIPTPLPLPATFGGRDTYIEQIRRQIASCDAVAATASAELLPYLRQATADRAMRFVGSADDLAALAEDEGALPRIAQGALCYLQFSSGSTRFPAGVAVTHKAALHNAGAIARHGLRINNDDRCTSWLPLYHDMGLVGFLLTPLCCQMSVDYLATRDFARRPLMWLNLITRNRGSLSFSPTFGYELCARRAAGASIEGIDLASWRVAGIGGDMIRPKVMARFAATFAPVGFRAGAFVPSYGMAESVLAVSFAPLGDGVVTDRVALDVLAAEGQAAPAEREEGARDFALCGLPMPGHAIAIRDEDGNALSARRVGRVYTRGDSVMQGYFNAPEETAQVLDADGWLDTGDLGYWLGDQVVITGRVKDLILVNGRNVWPQDLEWAAERLAGLRSGDVAAFSVDDAEGERVVALVQCRPTDQAARNGLMRAVEGAIAETCGVECTAIPVGAHTLPQTSSGKLSRSRAKALYLAGAFAGTRQPA
ncbi:MAG: fatty acyl-AMP ligase [Alphaproteobacteria bacterium]|nr:fatty acyl-AMP ligase [Alphaproteobacteria bacterium]